MKLEIIPLETKRLWLRPVELEDASDLFQVYGDPEVVLGSTTMPPFQTIDDMVSSIKTHFLAYRQRGVPQSIALELKDNGIVIGVIDFHSIKKDIGELGYMIKKAYWNQGYIKEAMKGMLKIGFEQVGLRRIEAMVAQNNFGSWKALESNGFQKEGILRQYVKLNDDRYYDLTMYSILKHEYEEEQNEKRISYEV